MWITFMTADQRLICLFPWANTNNQIVEGRALGGAGLAAHPDLLFLRH